MLLDVAIWGVLPGPIVFIGAAVIVGSGLYLIHRERRPPVRRRTGTACATTSCARAGTARFSRAARPGSRRRRAPRSTLRAWRVAALVGLSGMLASAGWFTAMTLQNAAYVRTLGQIELVFTYLVSRLVFAERTSRHLRRFLADPKQGMEDVQATAAAAYDRSPFVRLRDLCALRGF